MLSFFRIPKASSLDLGLLINSSLREITEELCHIVKVAESLTLQESEHWFDNVTVSRHMKQMNEAYKVFEKTAKEMTGLQQRLESAYDDMGTVLNRYYKVGSSISEDSYTVGVDDGRAGESVDFPGSDMSMNEDSYTAGVTDKGPAFDDHMTKDKSKRLK